MTSELPRFVRDLLASTPPAGTGVHLWLFRCARYLHHCRTEGEISELLRAMVADCGRNVGPREIADAVQNSRGCAWSPADRYDRNPRPVSKWPALNLEQVEAITSQGFGLNELRESSPQTFTDDRPRTEGIVDFLCGGRDVLLCCGWAKDSFDTRTREEWRGGLARMQLIVPSPMLARKGLTQEGKESAHTLSNTGPRRFLVVEFDQGTADDHAALLNDLAARAPLALAVHSGSKSLHGWFYCAGQTEDEARRFMRLAVSLGADPATWTRSQFVRMPDGQRDNGKRQAVHYFNPEVLK